MALSSANSHLPSTLWPRQAGIFPPVGIYHPMWGAARHHTRHGDPSPAHSRSDGLSPLADESKPFLRLQLDHIGMTAEHHKTLLDSIAARNRYHGPREYCYRFAQPRRRPLCPGSHPPARWRDD